MKYMVEPTFDWANLGKVGTLNRFKELRAWMWEQFGPGCELFFLKLHSVNDNTESEERWCWRSTNDGEMRIYFKSDEEFSWFKLKWL
jgi:hypothetical protein